MNIYEMEKYTILSQACHIFNAKQLTRSHFNMKENTNQNMLVIWSVVYSSYLSNYQKDFHCMEKF